jgi:hypothetical protein
MKNIKTVSLKPKLLGFMLIVGLFFQSDTYIVQSFKVYKARILQRELPYSKIVLPLHLNFETLEKIIDVQVPQKILQQKKVGKILFAECWRVGPIELTKIGNQLKLTVPVLIKLSRPTKGFTKLLGKVDKLGKKQFTTCKASISFTTIPAIDDKLKINSEFIFLQFAWIENPQLSIFGVSVDISSQIEKRISDKSKLIGKMVTKNIREKVRLTPIRDSIWKKINAPILLNKKVKKVWLKARELTYSATKIYLTDSGITTNLAINFKARFVQDSFNRDCSPMPPKIVFVESKEHLSNLHLNGAINNKELNELLNAKVESKKMNLYGYNITIESVSLKLSNTTIECRVNILGDLDGSFSFTGIPMIDDSSRLTFSELNYEVASENTMVNLGDLFMHEYARNELRSYLNIDLNDYFNIIKSRLDSSLNHSKLGNSLSIRTNDVTVKGQDLGFNKDSIYFTVKAVGEVEKANIKFPKKLLN